MPQYPPLKDSLQVSLVHPRPLPHPPRTSLVYVCARVCMQGGGRRHVCACEHAYARAFFTGLQRRRWYFLNAWKKYHRLRCNEQVRSVWLSRPMDPSSPPFPHPPHT